MFKERSDLRRSSDLERSLALILSSVEGLWEGLPGECDGVPLKRCKLEAHKSPIVIVKEPLDCVQKVEARRVLDAGVLEEVWRETLAPFDLDVIRKTPLVRYLLANFPVVVEEYLGLERPECLALAVRSLSVEMSASSLPIDEMQEEGPWLRSGLSLIRKPETPCQPINARNCLTSLPP